MTREEEATNEEAIAILTKMLNSAEYDLLTIDKNLTKCEREQLSFSISFYKGEMAMTKRTIGALKRAIKAIREEKL